MKKKIALAKLVVGCLILSSGCGEEETTKEKKEYRKTEPREIVLTEQTLVEETFVEETILGW